MNQASGDIVGEESGVLIDRGGNVSGTGINTVTNYGDISSISGPAIQFGRNSAGTIDNYGTVNSRTPNPSTDSARGILLDTTRSVTLNNHAGASIKSASGPSPNAVNILAGTHVVTNEGLIRGVLARHPGQRRQRPDNQSRHHRVRYGKRDQFREQRQLSHT